MTVTTSTPDAVSRFFTASKLADPAAWSAVFTDDAVVQDPVGQPPLHGRAELHSRMAGFLPLFRSFGLEPVDTQVAGDRVAVAWRGTAVTTAGDELDWTGINLFTVAGERISAMDGYFDASVFASLWS